MLGQTLQRELDRSGGKTNEPLALQQLRQLKHCVRFVIHQKQLLAWLCESVHEATPALDEALT
ncbi:hypothetical protein D3C76_1675090 [compost metagenome]